MLDRREAHLALIRPRFMPTEVETDCHTRQVQAESHPLENRALALLQQRQANRAAVGDSRERKVVVDRS